MNEWLMPSWIQLFLDASTVLEIAFTCLKVELEEGHGFSSVVLLIYFVPVTMFMLLVVAMGGTCLWGKTGKHMFPQLCGPLNKCRYDDDEL
eukprot:2396946-Amphidinium_carterae.2